MPTTFRRRLRIGVGGMKLAILLFGLWLGHQVDRAKQQRLAVAAVKVDADPIGLMIGGETSGYRSLTRRLALARIAPVCEKGQLT